MKVSEAIKSRRSVRHFDPNYVMPEQEIKEFFEAAMCAPTSFNIQNWRFVVVTDKEQKAKLRAAAWDQSQVSDASITVVLCADLKAWEKTPERYWKDTPKEVQDFLVPMIKPFYEGKEQLQRDEAMRSIGFAAQNLMLLAKEKGYDSSPMIGFDPEQFAKILNLPKDYVIGMMLSIGKATKPSVANPGRIGYEEAVFRDKF
jgi:nitroreductase